LQVIFSKRAAKAVESMNNPDKTRIKEAILKLPKGDIKKLKHYSPAYRLRVGDWRILFDMGDIIEIADILPRASAYKQ
jgi:mRNA interferase RelE/StbE